MMWYLEDRDYFGCHLLSGRDWFPFYVARVVKFDNPGGKVMFELAIVEMGRS